jgi:hypothetical protein
MRFNSIHLVMGSDCHQQSGILFDHGKHNAAIIGYRNSPKVF